jgi:hypothetical protein
MNPLGNTLALGLMELSCSVFFLIINFPLDLVVETQTNVSQLYYPNLNQHILKMLAFIQGEVSEVGYSGQSIC